jgi:hypothetical protein
VLAETIPSHLPALVLVGFWGQRRAWDSNPRGRFRALAVFKSVGFQTTQAFVIGGLEASRAISKPDPIPRISRDFRAQAPSWCVQARWHRG